MDRKRLLKLLSKDLDLDDALDIIEEYCIEWDKEQEDIKKFKGVLTYYPFILMACAKEALEYFEKQHFIVKLYDISDLRGVKLLKIF